MESCCAVVRPVDWRIRGRQFWVCNVQAAGATWLDAQIFIYGNDGVFFIKKRGMYSTGRLHNPKDFCHKLERLKCTDVQNKQQGLACRFEEITLDVCGPHAPVVT